MKKILPAIVVLFVLLVFISPETNAHSNNSEGFSTIEVNKEHVTYELQLDMLELSHALQVGSDENESLDITQLNNILNENKAVLEKYIDSRLTLYADGVPIEGVIQDTKTTMMNSRPFAIINLLYSVHGEPESLLVNYNIFFEDSDPSHANIAKVIMDGKQQESIFTYEVRDLKIGEMTFLNKALQFLLLGLEHIFTGYDHILFVISLLFGARTVRHILSLITAFTIAHSLTLALATLQIVTLPSTLIESAIALSIVYVALQNIFNQDSKHHPLVALGFGLIHGFGFAGILSEMRLDGGHLATSLLFFNAGIELGQIIIVSLVFPIIVYFRKRWNTKWVIPGISTGVLAFGLVWFIQRAFL